MTMLIKQSTAVTVPLGPFVDNADGFTPETGLTISQADIRLSKNGGAFAQTNNAAGATHMENGWYSIPLNTTDTNTLGQLTVAVYESGALPCWLNFTVVEANVYDSLVAGTDELDVSLVQWLGVAPAALVATFVQSDVRTWVAEAPAGVYQGAVWLDNQAANVATVVGVDGTPQKPVSTVAAAITLLASTGLKQLNIIRGIFTPASAFSRTRVVGVGDRFNCGLDLNSQAHDRCQFENLNITGISTSAQSSEFIDCYLTTVTIPQATLIDCDLDTSYDATATGSLFARGCTFSNAAGTFSLNVGLGATLYDCAGDVVLAAAAAHVATIATFVDGPRVTVGASFVAGTVLLEGWAIVTNSAAGAVVTDLTAAPADADADAVWDENIVAAHGAASSAGLLLRVLGALISTRANNPTLNALLGVADVAGADVPGTTTDEVWDEDLSVAHAVVGSAGTALANILIRGGYASWAAAVAAGSALDQVARIGGASVYDRATESLEAISTAAAATPAAIWNFVLTSVPTVANGAGTVLLQMRNWISQMVTGPGRG